MQPRRIALAFLLIGALPATYVLGQETNTQLPAEVLQTAPVAELPLPNVERRFGNVGADAWSGKRFSDIIAPGKIQRIVLTSERSFLHFGQEGRAAQEAKEQGDNDAFNAAYEATEQAGYDAFMAQVVASSEKAQKWSLGANERRLAELMVLTTDDQLFRIEIVKSATSKDSGALLISGLGNAARIEVRNSPFIELRD